MPKRPFHGFTVPGPLLRDAQKAAAAAKFVKPPPAALELARQFTRMFEGPAQPTAGAPRKRRRKQSVQDRLAKIVYEKLKDLKPTEWPKKDAEAFRLAGIPAGAHNDRMMNRVMRLVDRMLEERRTESDKSDKSDK
jgi:hypothetical protein